MNNKNDNKNKIVIENKKIEKFEMIKINRKYIKCLNGIIKYHLKI